MKNWLRRLIGFNDLERRVLGLEFELAWAKRDLTDLMRACVEHDDRITEQRAMFEVFDDRLEELESDFENKHDDLERRFDDGDFEDRLGKLEDEQSDLDKRCDGFEEAIDDLEDVTERHERIMKRWLRDGRITHEVIVAVVDDK